MKLRKIRMAYSKEHIEGYLSELEAIDKLLAQRKVENGIYYYVPNLKQYKFHCSMAKRIVYCGSNRPLHSEFTRVKLYDGREKTLKDIEIGDEVISYDNEWEHLIPSKVTAIPFDKVEDSFLLETWSGEQVFCSKDHEFPCVIARSTKQTFLSLEMIGFLLNKVDNVSLLKWDTEYEKIRYVKVKLVKFLGASRLRCITIDSLSHKFLLSNNIFTMNSGKTEGATVECLFHALGYYPDWGVINGVHYKYPEEKMKFTPQKILWISPQFEHILKFVEPKFNKFLPKDRLVKKPKRNNDGSLSHMEIKHSSGGISVIDFASQEQPMMAFEGSDYDLVVADEPLSRPIFTSVTRGLIDRGGVMLMVFTPISEQWIKEEICDRADGKFIELFTADIMDNLFNIKGDPILNKQYIKEFEKLLTQDEKETRIHGRWYHMSGMVFKELDRDVHVIPDHDIKQSCPIYFILDPHDRNPHWGIWIYMDKTEDSFVCGEMIRTGEPKEYSRAVLEFERAKGWRVRKRIIDPNFGNKPKSVGSNVRVIDLFRSEGLNNLVLANDADEAGKLLIRSALHYDKTKPISLTNRPKLYFFKDGAKESFKSLSNLQYEDWASKKHNESKGKREDVQKRNEHIFADLKYYYNSRPRYEQIKVSDDLDKPIY